jgi:uncharacterized protein with FMN-binding domain
VRDGWHEGSSTSGTARYRVAVLMRRGSLIDIRILENRSTTYAQLAEGITGKVLEAQSSCVDVVTGASTTSRALAQAIGDALARGHTGPQPPRCPDGRLK